ncbi:PadR family transcriptional regulator [Brachybacterium saurashtrense]|uniref:PadR family transcriptional regulator n=1 Tax=Brachybacterium saurashtrense TaxID=556288 RepID=A0A345YQI3_9MICO|nr:PadR family transcriptional regulator [Brachybacterium saurashtrense]AXK46185.1 PadR family transcriptional regulator [Brachybacterium saurashtrense]RRR23925.1 PadR family transcriptional regulator [Brachybacterium saurashtrense]
MKLEHLLLGVLAMHPRTGYDLKKYMDTHGRFLRSNTQMSQVYRSLASMERHGWAVHELEPRPGATDAKRYALTEEGATVFLDWLTGAYSPPSRHVDPELQARLSFAGFMSRQEALHLLDVELEVRAAEIARYRDRDRSHELTPVLPYDDELAALVGEWSHRAGAAAMDAHLDRVAALRRELLDTPQTTPREPAVGFAAPPVDA